MLLIRLAILSGIITGLDAVQCNARRLTFSAAAQGNCGVDPRDGTNVAFALDVCAPFDGTYDVEPGYYLNGFEGVDANRPYTFTSAASAYRTTISVNFPHTSVPAGARFALLVTNGDYSNIVSYTNSPVTSIYATDTTTTVNVVETSTVTATTTTAASTTVAAPQQTVTQPCTTGVVTVTAAAPIITQTTAKTSAAKTVTKCQVSVTTTTIDCISKTPRRYLEARQATTAYELAYCPAISGPPQQTTYFTSTVLVSTTSTTVTTSTTTVGSTSTLTSTPSPTTVCSNVQGTSTVTPATSTVVITQTVSQPTTTMTKMYVLTATAFKGGKPKYCVNKCS